MVLESRMFLSAEAKRLQEQLDHVCAVERARDHVVSMSTCNDTTPVATALEKETIY